MNITRTCYGLLALAAIAVACSPDGLPVGPPASALTASRAGVPFTDGSALSAVKFWEAGATVSWNQLATDLAAAAPAPGINASRLYAYLSLSSALPRRHRQPLAHTPDRCGHRWRFGRRAELVLPRHHRPARSGARRATGFRPVARR